MYKLVNITEKKQSHTYREWRRGRKEVREWKAQITGYKLASSIVQHRESLVAQMVKHLPTVRKTRVRSLGWEDPLEKEMATHSSTLDSSTLAWKIPWTEGVVGYSPWGLKESDTTERLHFVITVNGKCVCVLSRIRLFEAPWTIARQAPLSIFQARILELPFPAPGNLPGPGMGPESPALAGGFFTTSTTWEAL